MTEEKKESYVLKIAREMLKNDEQLPETHLPKLTEEERKAVLLIFGSPQGFVMILGIVEQVCINNMAVFQRLQQAIMEHLEYSADNVVNQQGADPKETKH